MSQQRHITDDLEALLSILPESIVKAVHKANQFDKLLEIILDLGRVPTARYVDEEIILLHGIIKKARTTSKQELDTARRRQASYMKAHQNRKQ